MTSFSFPKNPTPKRHSSVSALDEFRIHSPKHAGRSTGNCSVDQFSDTIGVFDFFRELSASVWPSERFPKSRNDRVNNENIFAAADLSMFTSCLAR
jgi:hypothetical protein